MKRALVVVAALLFVGCQDIKIPPCVQHLIDGTISQHPECVPSPKPSPPGPTPPPPSASPSAPPASPSPSPVASPSPSPSPSASPSPAPSPSASPALPVMTLHVCPDWYPRRPDHVRLKHGQRPAGANPRFGRLLDSVPEMNEAKYCSDENGRTRGVPCEQWAACVTQGLHDPAEWARHPNDAKSSWEPAVKAEGPGFPWSDVERRSREADPAEPPCPPDDHICYTNYYLLNFILGPDGSQPGMYHVCIAPTEEEINGPNGECWDFDLEL